MLICPQVITDYDLRESATDFIATICKGNFKHNKEKPPSDRRQISSRNMHWSWVLFGTYLGLINTNSNAIPHQTETSQMPANDV